MIAAGQAGILFSVAAGNAGANLATTADYPASFGLSDEIVVAASDANDARASFSNYGGPTALAAPGTNILSTFTRATFPTSPFAFLSGTSMSVPFVTGALALLRSQYPTAPSSELRSRLVGTVDKKSAWSSITASGGRLNAYAALAQARPTVPTITSPVGGESYAPGSVQLAQWQTHVPAGNPTTPYRVEFTPNAAASTTYSESFGASTSLPPAFATPADSDAAWIVAPGAGPGGSNALQSGLGATASNKAAWVATTVKAVVAGNVSFSYRIDSDSGDFFSFFIDGNRLLSLAGQTGWTSVSFGVGPGVHTLSWAYQTDNQIQAGPTSAAWIAALSVTGVDNATWSTVATTTSGATSAQWAMAGDPTGAAKLRVCQDTGSPCAASAASESPAVFSSSGSTPGSPPAGPPGGPSASAAGSVAINDGGGLTVQAGGPSVGYSVALTTQPAAPVTVHVAPDPALNASPSTLTFDAGNWSVPQNVSVNAPARRLTGALTVGIAHSVTSADPAYNQISVRSVQVTISLPGAPAGYWLVARDGGIFSFGDAMFFGSTGAIHLNQPIVAAMPTSTRAGYWLVARDGGIFSFGDARFFGSTGAIHLNQPIVAAMPTPSGAGYWLVASDGGIFSFGDATFFGSTGAIHLNQPIVAAMPTPTGAGYWLVARDGGIFSFGDAHFFGSTGAIHLNQPIVSAMPSAAGYWLVASDGGIFSFGDATFSGSTGAIHLNQPIVVAMPTASRGGYWLVASDGGIFNFGDARFFGSTGAIHLNQPIVAALAR
jgi:hypothetical protein